MNTVVVCLALMVVIQAWNIMKFHKDMRIVKTVLAHLVKSSGVKFGDLNITPKGDIK